MQCFSMQIIIIVHNGIKYKLKLHHYIQGARKRFACSVGRHQQAETFLLVSNDTFLNLRRCFGVSSAG